MKRTFLLLSMLVAILVLPGVVCAAGNLMVSSTPSGAEIFLDSSDTIHMTPYNLTGQAPGSHTLMLRLSGYQDNTQTVVIPDNDTLEVSVTMAVIPISAPTVASVSPSSGYNNGLKSVTITGAGFVTGAVTRLVKTGQTNLTGVNTAFVSSTQITTDYPLNGATAGSWDVYIINPDGGIGVGSGQFAVENATAATISSISPNTGTVNTTVGVTIVGTGFQTNARMRLTRSGYNEIIGTITSQTATQLTGTFNLNERTPGAWAVTVLYDGTDSHAITGPVFTINAVSTTSPNGTVKFSTNPTGASAYLGSVYEGKTYSSITVDNITPGTYTVRYQKAGYNEWSRQFAVTAGNTTDAYASLTMVTVDTTAPTPVPTTIRTTATTYKRSTKATPTPWPSATPKPSPVGIFVVIGAVGLGLVAIRRK